MRLIISLCIVLSVSILCVPGVPALADEIEPPNVGMSCGTDDGLSVPWTPTLSAVPHTTQFTSSGYIQDTDGHWEMTWDMTVDTDPYVSGTWALKNLTAIQQNYTFTVSLPVAALPYTLMGGSMGGSTTDSNFNGQGGVSTITPAPLYYGLIDGVGELPIYADPSSWGYAFAGATTTIPAVNSGLPGPTIPGPGVTTDIGIKLRFSLSPGDSASFTSFFVVDIPEPASLSLLALGGLALLRRKH